MDDNYVETEELTYAKNKDPMYDDDILKNNHFNGLSYKELQKLEFSDLVLISGNFFYKQSKRASFPFEPERFRWARLN